MIDKELQTRMNALQGRHTATAGILRFFDYGHLPAEGPRAVSAHCAGLAIEMAETLKDGPELTTGLRKLLEAKDCFVRQAIVDGERT